MASRLICKAQLLKGSPVRQVARSYATESNQATHHFAEESFGNNFWRNSVIAVVATAAWFRVDQHLVGASDEKHPITKWFEYHMTTSEQNDQINHANLAGATAAAEYKLFAQDAQRAPIHRMRNPESFENASPRGLVTGNQVDLTDLKIRSD
ncbi:uncharacterized protein EV154DRAFT_452749 [Mucor mucedo]|uniref:uncharacterized protein n=1 Tax=Mucor mucedo TaxID=29922 RepID=UPI00221EF532|nr:uncharacterized protein EV154DRAFT_452749 [Mucor mucedo]KAI7873106.1 hypothetical protein EV154DRAFT_452749 [Mucor mucedo]